MKKEFIIYENMESVHIVRNTTENLKIAKGFEYELLDKKEMQESIKAMQESETHFVIYTDEKHLINQLKVMGYNDESINLLTHKEKQVFNLENAIITISNRINLPNKELDNE